MKALKSLGLVLGFSLVVGFDKPMDLMDKPTNFSHQVKHPTVPFKKSEQISYFMHYGLLSAGEATVSIKEQDTNIDGNPVYHMVGEGKTLSVFEWFYKVRDVYETYIDEKTLAPRKFVRRVNEGGYIINRDYHFVPEKNLVNTGEKGSINTPEDVQDMLSSFYYLRTLDFRNAKKGDIYRINSFMDYEMWPFYVKFMGIEEVSIDLGTFKCYKFVPVVQEGRVFQAEEDLEIWVTADVNKVPVLAKANIIVGSVKMELTGYKNLVAPIAKVRENKGGFFDWL